MTAFDSTIAAVLDEIDSARAKHGNPVRRHVAAWWNRAPSLTFRQQLADSAREVCQGEADREPDGASWETILLEEVHEALAEDDPVARRAELIQVAAMAFCEIEQLDAEIKAACEHDWLDANSLLAGDFRFCTRCDREEWSSGAVIVNPRS